MLQLAPVLPSVDLAASSNLENGLVFKITIPREGGTDEILQSLLHLRNGKMPSLGKVALSLERILEFQGLQKCRTYRRLGKAARRKQFSISRKSLQ